MGELGRRERLMWLLEERRMRLLRSEARGVLAIVADQTGEALELIEPQPGQPEPLSVDTSRDPYVCEPEMPIGEAVAQLGRLIREDDESWLINPGPRRQFCAIRCARPPSTILLLTMATWSREGLMMAPEHGPGWIHLDLLVEENLTTCEVLISKA